MRPPDAPRNQFGTASLILGTAALISCWLLIGVPLGVAAVVTGDIARGRVRRGEATNPRFAIAGMALGAVAIAAGLAILGYYAWLDSKDPDWFQRCLDNPATNNC
jgi:formate hydrogenlyase subunit 3/multisubunit Na+/H+ antiporter MnhD subunit